MPRPTSVKKRAIKYIGPDCEPICISADTGIRRAMPAFWAGRVRDADLQVRQAVGRYSCLSATKGSTRAALAEGIIAAAKNRPGDPSAAPRCLTQV
jgi:hypothetical protein